MRDFAVDLHMHSCLSPCGDELMTPNNIPRMALLKGLDMIAVSDHNTALQLPAVAEVCGELGLALLPALEVTTREEVHLLAYFPTVERALAFSEAIYPHLAPIPNRPDFFGRQVRMDADDEETGEEGRLLISALDLSLSEVSALVREMGGLPVPAHINRGGNGLLNALGFLPPEPAFEALEISKNLPCPGDYPKHKILHASDAHRLEDISEREHFLPLPECSPAGFFAWARGET